MSVAFNVRIIYFTILPFYCNGKQTRRISVAFRFGGKFFHLARKQTQRIFVAFIRLPYFYFRNKKINFYTQTQRISVAFALTPYFDFYECIITIQTQRISVAFIQSKNFSTTMIYIWTIRLDCVGESSNLITATDIRCVCSLSDYKYRVVLHLKTMNHI